MKILFINYGRENLGIEYLSAMIKPMGYEVYLANDPGLFSQEDNVFYNQFLKNIFDRKKHILRIVKEIRPDIVAFSVYTTTYKWGLALAKEIKKEMNAIIIFGGIHVTLVPEEIIKNDFIDYLVLGEAEEAFLELIESVKNGKRAREIKNVWGREDGRIFANSLRNPVDLNTLPFPDKSLFEKDIRIEDDYIVMTSRGCPYSCSFCCESYLHHIYKGKYFRRRSANLVIEELRVMKDRYNFKRVMFFDSILFTDKKWLEDFLTMYREQIRIPFRCTGHVNFFDYDIGKQMKEAGCYCIDFGIQSFNQRLRMEILNRFEDNSQIKTTFDICDRLGVRYDIDLMLGLPCVTERDYMMPVDFLKKSKCLNRLKCYYLSYFPKLAIINKAKEKGMLNDEDVKRINEGEANDWFHLDSIKDSKHKRWKENFEKLYKIYPLIPNFLKRSINNKKICHWFIFVPNFIIILLQLYIGLRHKDYRFRIYINNYLHHFIKFLTQRNLK